jgi:hypothetical protein
MLSTEAKASAISRSEYFRGAPVVPGDLGELRGELIKE